MALALSFTVVEPQFFMLLTVAYMEETFKEIQGLRDSIGVTTLHPTTLV